MPAATSTRSELRSRFSRGAAGSWRGGTGQLHPSPKRRPVATYRPRRDVWMSDTSAGPRGQLAALNAMCWETSRPAQELVLAELAFRP